MNHLHSFLETVSFRDLRLISPRGTFHVFLDAYETFVFCQRGLAGEGWRQKSAAQQNNSLLLKACKLKQCAIPETVGVFLTC